MKKALIIKDDSLRVFSIKARGRSFRFAFEGLHAFFSEQHNAIIHLLVTALVFFAAVFFKINKMELIAVGLATGFVWAAELFNTAIEKLADMVSKDFHPQIKFIKDVSAAAVLVAAISAFVTGVIVFVPKLFL
jgi:diacylglycerol kinase (ATP)